MAKPKKKEKPFMFKQPCGDSMVIQRGNMMTRTTNKVICGFCGTTHPEMDGGNDGYTLFKLLGRVGVMDCCGKLVDVIYGEWKRGFMDKYIEEFSIDPLGSEFYIFRNSLPQAIESWREKAEEVSREAYKTQQMLPVRL